MTKPHIYLMAVVDGERVYCCENDEANGFGNTACAAYWNWKYYAYET